MENLKEALIQFAHSNPNLFPNDAADSCSLLIEQCFPQFFPDFHTPNHPPYAAMIYRAIWELNKKRGSSERSISKFIKKEYADLPWAHRTLLKHHLEKLCDRNEIHMTDKQCYLLAGAESELGMQISEPSKKRKKQKRETGSEVGKKISRPHKKYKKIENCGSGIQETNEKEKIGIHKQKRKQGLKSKTKRSKGMKRHEINETKLQLLNEANLKQKNDDSNEQKMMLEIHRSDLEIQEQNVAGEESYHDDSDCINSMQIQIYNNPELLQLEESPDSTSLDKNPILHENVKRVWTRSQLKTASKKDALANMPNYKTAIVEFRSNEEQPISRSPSSEKPLMELLKSIPSKLKTQFPDDEPPKLICSQQDQQDQQPEKSTIEDKPKRRGRPSKCMKPKKDQVLRNSKSAMKSQKSDKKGKVGKKKVQPKNKRDGRHKMTRRSSRNPSF